MEKSLKKLVEELYNEEEKNLVNIVVEETKIDEVPNESNHLLNYLVLSIPVEKYMGTRTSMEEAGEFYDVSLKFMSKVDCVILDITSGLSNVTGRDIHEEFEKSITLDSTKPEFSFLIKTVRNIMKKEGEVNHG